MQVRHRGSGDREERETERKGRQRDRRRLDGKSSYKL